MFDSVKRGLAPIGRPNDGMPQLGGKRTFARRCSEIPSRVERSLAKGNPFADA